MLDREMVREFLDEKIETMEVPPDIDKDVLLETFCRYTEYDTYEWLKDNFKSFFNHGDPDWDWIKDRIEQYE